MEKKAIQNGKEKTAVIREYKDPVFRMIFKEKIELLSLFNAINNTHYTDPDILEINTLENAVYMSMKNDISCVLDMRMSSFEHQSTINPNMPLRYLMYVSALYEKQIWIKNRAEVIKMSIFEYNEELHRKSLLEEGREEGWKKGLEEGRKDVYCHMLNNGKTPEEISSFTGESLEYLRCLQKELAKKNN